VNSLPKTVTRQRCDCDLNPGPSAPESSTLTTRLPSHRRFEDGSRTEQNIPLPVRARRLQFRSGFYNMITWQSCFIVRVEGCASIAYFQCDNGECISLFHVCDGKAHCLDASDERNCTSVTMGVNSLPKTVTRQRRDCDLNPGPSAPESSTLTTRLPSHRHYDTVLICSAPVSVSEHISKTTC